MVARSRGIVLDTTPHEHSFITQHPYNSHANSIDSAVRTLAHPLISSSLLQRISGFMPMLLDLPILIAGAHSSFFLGDGGPCRRIDQIVAYRRGPHTL